ncbi:hypothetical protein A3K24_01520 [candidate division Kazan bacterium RIFCSPHIGHO2_01_FULL_44_14]|uniref:Fibronectin type-III domain-containing protein n=1 Tax=candidate division Kazan bacterium RIFCSPLOWO2_01_FULL_45_19 TaxID=1798538 RepID=A0A1F4NPY8_UNCK3|nr:hypothetical protein [uncultured bacterium]OGB73515.1 MAG: hypothetical protein A3K51_01520 [candidate division Kazan bacterium RIFCSPLOWO2_01_FULL_45_19]OGB77760.1 MAG: hypothetical protein A3K24_01520 [candidate division Kazan bacterium RIFCSPHIGHO2_01_FULL_44_14]
MYKTIVNLVLGINLVFNPIALGWGDIAHAAIDSPRAVVVESGDEQDDLRIWWVNPDSVDINHVNVYLSTLPLETFGILATQTNVRANEVSSAVVSNLQLSTWYYIYLTAVDNKGNESIATTTLKRRLGTSVDVTSPVSVSLVSVSDLKQNSLTIHWTNPGDDDFFRTSVYRSTESNVLADGNNLVSRLVAFPSTVKEYMDNNLKPDTIYYYRLVTEDTKGNLGDSVIVSATTLSAPVAPPTNGATQSPADSNPIIPTVLPDPVIFDYQATWVSQNGVLNDAKTAHVISTSVGGTVILELTLKNTGSSWWYFESPDNAHEVKLGTWHEQDRISNFKSNSWLTDNRVMTLSKVVPTGAEVTFNFALTIPSGTANGTYREYFRPVAEYVEWFGPEGIFWQLQVN